MRRIPNTLRELPAENYIEKIANITDDWGHEFQYAIDKENHTLTITSYGRDGVIGGIGDDADIAASYYYQKPDGTFWAGSEDWEKEAKVLKEQSPPASAQN